MENNDIFSAESSILDKLHAAGHKRYDVSTSNLMTIGEADTIKEVYTIIQRDYRSNFPNVDNIPGITFEKYIISDGVTGESTTISANDLNNLSFMLKILGK